MEAIIARYIDNRLYRVTLWSAWQPKIVRGRRCFYMNRDCRPTVSYLLDIDKNGSMYLRTRYCTRTASYRSVDQCMSDRHSLNAAGNCCNLPKRYAYSQNATVEANTFLIAIDSVLWRRFDAGHAVERVGYPQSRRVQTKTKTKTKTVPSRRMVICYKPWESNSEPSVC
jgi:hypothetical protein